MCTYCSPSDWPLSSGRAQCVCDLGVRVPGEDMRHFWADRSARPIAWNRTKFRLRGKKAPWLKQGVAVLQLKECERGWPSRQRNWNRWAMKSKVTSCKIYTIKDASVISYILYVCMLDTIFLTQTSISHIFTITFTIIVQKLPQKVKLFIDYQRSKLNSLREVSFIDETNATVRYGVVKLKCQGTNNDKGCTFSINKI